jgi:hypothetical protein
MASLTDKSSKMFLKRGEGRLGTSVPLVPANPTNPLVTNTIRQTKRSLHLKRPQSAGFMDGTMEDDEPRSYAEIHARQSVPRPMSAPATPDKFMAARKSVGGVPQGEKDSAGAASMSGANDGYSGEDAQTRRLFVLHVAQQLLQCGNMYLIVHTLE